MCVFAPRNIYIYSTVTPVAPDQALVFTGGIMETKLPIARAKSSKLDPRPNHHHHYAPPRHDTVRSDRTNPLEQLSICFDGKRK